MDRSHQRVTTRKRCRCAASLGFVLDNGNSAQESARHSATHHKVGNFATLIMLAFLLFVQQPCVQAWSINLPHQSALHSTSALHYRPKQVGEEESFPVPSKRRHQSGKLSITSSRPNTQRSFRNVEHEDDVDMAVGNHLAFLASRQGLHHPRSGILQRTPHKDSAAQSRQSRFRVYCDLDGVLVDFCHGIRELYREEELYHHGMARSSKSKPDQNSQNGNDFCVDDLHRGHMWQRVAQADSFFENLPWMEGGQSLWETVKKLQPTILTGVPVNPEQSRQQKFQWCRRELGMPKVYHIDLAGHNFQHKPVSSSSSIFAPLERQHPVVLDQGHHANDSSTGDGEEEDYVCRVITCWSNNKHYESGPGAVLIDDRIELGRAWEAKGGIFIHHKGDAEDTIAQLEEHGIIDEFL
eukprot:CAMPEP_0172449368 /NCGR_PEP_ID=MMETSP1065-20121228/8102_1 /TAXON_ID=265537 /ORGANISM="Amphiprora paludosa, Strain CCMP125" /LENGTH=409 /DNA_ID=CAMNT_0013201033 /DNA_START=59 /DNA_END=1288 /DNA_ORIENTATION=+